MNRLRLLLLALALGLAGMFGWRVGHGPGTSLALMIWAVPEKSGRQDPAVDPRARLEAQFAAVPDYQRYFAELKSDFPGEYSRVLDAVPRKIGVTDAAYTVAPDIDRAFFQAARALRQTHGALAARAGNMRMQRISSAQGAMMEALAKTNARLCVDFFYGGAEADFYQAMSRNRALAAEFAASWLDAIADGRKSGNVRPDPDDADVQAFDDALLAKGLSRDAIDVLLENKAANPPLPDEALCQAGIAYFQVLATLPEQARERLLARIIYLAAQS